MYRLRVEFPAVGTVYTLTAEAGAYAMTGQAAALSVVSEPYVPTGLYRDETPMLFQPVAAYRIPSRLSAPGYADDYSYNNTGPNYRMVDSGTGWLWANPGGDWLDSTLTAQGTSAWASVATPTGAYTSGHAPVAHTMTVTTAVQHVQTSGLWCAFQLKTGTAPRVIASPKNSDSGIRPYIAVTYTDATTATLACTLMGSAVSSSSTPSTDAQTYGLPLLAATTGTVGLFAEFDRPTKAVSSAELHFWVTQQQWSGADTNIRLLGILNPPTRGASAGAGFSDAVSADADLLSNPNVWAVQTIPDGTVTADLVGATQGFQDDMFSPDLHGAGARDTNKYPDKDYGKWVGGTNDGVWKNLAVVDSSYTGEGFVPLAPGLSALRTHIDGMALNDGDQVTTSGRAGTDARLLLPWDEIEELDHLRVRYYQRLHLAPIDYPMTPENRKHFLSGGGKRWADRAGKGGIGFDCAGALGGYSGTSGGRGGWQMRDSWYLTDNNMGGPNEGLRIAFGYHLYDFLAANPVGHRYGANDHGTGERYGQIGGFGGWFEPDRWYCVEKEMKLNTVDGVTYPDYIADGYLRTWIDGVLVYELNNAVFRQLPANLGYPSSNQVTPMATRKLGHRGLLMNLFYGGQTWPTESITEFFSAIVVARGSAGYIGMGNF